MNTKTSVQTTLLPHSFLRKCTVNESPMLIISHSLWLGGKLILIYNNLFKLWLQNPCDLLAMNKTMLVSPFNSLEHTTETGGTLDTKFGESHFSFTFTFSQVLILFRCD